MSVATLEQQAFGEPLTITERVTAGLIAAIAAVGHAVFGAAALVFFYLLLVGL